MNGLIVRRSAMMRENKIGERVLTSAMRIGHCIIIIARTDVQ